MTRKLFIAKYQLIDGDWLRSRAEDPAFRNAMHVDCGSARVADQQWQGEAQGTKKFAASNA